MRSKNKGDRNRRELATVNSIYMERYLHIRKLKPKMRSQPQAFHATENAAKKQKQNMPEKTSRNSPKNEFYEATEHFFKQ